MMELQDADAEKQCFAVIPVRPSGIVACIIQSLLTALCLAISFYSLATVQSNRPIEWKSHQSQPVQLEKNIGIYLEVMGEVLHQEDKLKFDMRWGNRVDLAEDAATVSFQCSGPYVVYLDACSVDMDGQGNNGTLTLWRPNADRIDIPLHSRDDCDRGNSRENSQWDQRMLSFTGYDNVLLGFTSKSLKLRYLRLGFHYLLGDLDVGLCQTPTH